MATIYVSTSGDDNNDGLTPEFPKLTYTAAQSAAGSGGTVLGKRGDVWRDDFALAADRTYSCYGDDTLPYPEINGSDLISGAGFEWHQSTENVNEWYLTGSGGVDPSQASSSYFFVDDVFYSSGALGSLVPFSTAYGDNDGLGFSTFYIYSRTDPNSKKIEVSRRVCISTSVYNNVNFEKTRLVKSTLAMRYGGDNFNIRNCIFEDCGRWVLTENPLTNSRIENNIFRRCYSSTAGYILGGIDTTNVTVFGNIFTDLQTTTAMSFAAYGDIKILNNTFAGSKSTIVNVRNGTYDFRNNTFTGCGYSHTGRPVKRSSGTVNWGLNNVLPSPMSKYPVLDGITPAVSQLEQQPKFVKGRQRGFVGFTEDDYYWPDYATTKHISRGFRMSYGLHRTDTAMVTAEDWSNILSDYQDGIDFTAHTRGHPTIDATVGIIIQYTGEGACALSIDVDYPNKSGSLITICDNADDNLNLDFSTYTKFVTEFEGDGDSNGIVDAINANPNYTASYATNTGRTKTWCLEPVTSLDITSQQDLMINRQNFLDEEFNGNKADLETYLGAGAIQGTHYPNGPYSDETIDEVSQFLIASGFKYGRLAGPTGTTSVNNFDAFKIPVVTYPDDITSLDEARSFIFGVLQCAEFGNGYFNLVHQDENFPYDLYLDAALEYDGEAEISSLREMVNYITENSLSDDQRNYYLRVVDESDFRLKSDSPLKNAGDTTAVSGIPDLYTLDGQQVTDESGEVVGDVHIGAYGVASLPAPAKRRRSFGLGTPTLGF